VKNIYFDPKSEKMSKKVILDQKRAKNVISDLDLATRKFEEAQRYRTRVRSRRSEARFHPKHDRRGREQNGK